MIYSASDCEKELELSRSRVLDYCKMVGAEKKGNSYIVTEAQLHEMKKIRFKSVEVISRSAGGHEI
jgi:hypothetical protein